MLTSVHLVPDICRNNSSSFCSLGLHAVPTHLHRVPPGSQAGWQVGFRLSLPALPPLASGHLSVPLFAESCLSPRGPGPALRPCSVKHVPCQDTVSREDTQTKRQSPGLFCPQSPSLSQLRLILAPPASLQHSAGRRRAGPRHPPLLASKSLSDASSSPGPGGSDQVWSRKGQESVTLNSIMCCSEPALLSLN